MNKLIGIIFLFLASTAFAQEKFMFVFLHPRTDNPDLAQEEVDRIMEGHMANINRLANEGKLIAAGPFEGGGGIFIFNSDSQEQVAEWLNTDPGVQAKRWNLEILRYNPMIGSVCAVAAPYEMTAYTFIHFQSNLKKFNVQQAGALINNHERFMHQLAETGNVIAYASFGGTDGGVLIMKGDVQPEIIQSDPAIMDFLFIPEFKKLWIAKGSFCESER